MVGALTLLVPGVLTSLAALLAIIKHFRPAPPYHVVFATKEELADLKEGIKEQLKEQREELNTDRKEMEERLGLHLESQDKQITSVNVELKSIGSQLGRIHGLLEQRTGK